MQHKDTQGLEIREIISTFFYFLILNPPSNLRDVPDKLYISQHRLPSWKRREPEGMVELGVSRTANVD
jgi:hypothetical protein